MTTILKINNEGRTRVNEGSEKGNNKIITTQRPVVQPAHPKTKQNSQ
jgi:hypothetical protein